VLALLLGVTSEIFRQSRTVGRIVIAGLAARALLGFALYWISSHNLPVLASFHTGDGFWTLAPDARSYFRDAALAARDGLHTVSDDRGSVGFVRLLAVWMRFVGIHPLSGLLLNCVAYVFMMTPLALAAVDPSRAVTAKIAAAVVSFAPLFLIDSTQTLKEALFAAIVLLDCWAIAIWTRALAAGRLPSAGALAAVAGTGLAFYVIAGIRAYFAMIAWGALVLTLTVLVIRLRPPARRMRAALSGAVLLVGFWIVYNVGAGPHYINPAARVLNYWVPGLAVLLDRGAASDPFYAVERGAADAANPARAAAFGVTREVERARESFDATSGATNIQTPFSSRLLNLGVGLLLFFLPVSLMRWFDLISFTGGRGLLLLTDVDTVVLVCGVGLLLVTMARRRMLAPWAPAVLHALLLASTTGLLMGYIVLNYGTFVRLRMLVVMPLISLAAFATARERPAQPEIAEPQTRDALVALLRCPACGGALRRPDSGLVCANCGRRFPIVNGIPRLVAAELDALARRTQDSFGYEWTNFDDWRVSGETNLQQYFGDLDPSTLRGAKVLDGGCGMGRHARQIAAWASHVVAVDFSRAIDAAAHNVRDCANVDCVQANLLGLPFDDGQFDFVYSLGVLHHIADTEAGLRELVRVTRPGGRVRVYLYWKRAGFVGMLLSIVSLVRKVTVRLPHPLLKALCWMLSCVLWAGVLWPYRLLRACGLRIDTWPLSVYTRYPFGVIYNDQFDRFSAPLEKRYDPDEARELLRRVGLQDVSVAPQYGWIADGTRPVPAP
jgi:SAM-dependent methyltransferase